MWSRAVVPKLRCWTPSQNVVEFPKGGRRKNKVCMSLLLDFLEVQGMSETGCSYVRFNRCVSLSLWRKRFGNRWSSMRRSSRPSRASRCVEATERAAESSEQDVKTQQTETQTRETIKKKKRFFLWFWGRGGVAFFGRVSNPKQTKSSL